MCGSTPLHRRRSAVWRRPAGMRASTSAGAQNMFYAASVVYRVIGRCPACASSRCLRQAPRRHAAHVPPPRRWRRPISQAVASSESLSAHMPVPAPYTHSGRRQGELLPEGMSMRAVGRFTIAERCPGWCRPGRCAGGHAAEIRCAHLFVEQVALLCQAQAQRTPAVARPGRGAHPTDCALRVINGPYGEQRRENDLRAGLCSASCRPLKSPGSCEGAFR